MFLSQFGGNNCCWPVLILRKKKKKKERKFVLVRLLSHTSGILLGCWLCRDILEKYFFSGFIWIIWYSSLLLFPDDHSDSHRGREERGEDIKSFNGTRQSSKILWCIRRSRKCLHSDGVSFSYSTPVAFVSVDGIQNLGFSLNCTLHALAIWVKCITWQFLSLICQ